MTSRSTDPASPRQRRAGPRVGAALTLAAAFVVAGATLVACFDLFHGTDDILTACENDAATPGCPHKAQRDAADTPPAATDFCAWTPELARAHATHACAWLGACETPLGGNAFGPCMFDALLAYDCAANPDHRVTGATHDLWDCLQKAATCGEVDACVFGGPQKSAICSGTGTTCKPDAPNVRVSCTDGKRPYAENCALWGKTCAESGGQTACAGASDGFACEVAGGGRTCNTGDGKIHWCTATDAHTVLDLGFDCASSGGGACNGYADSGLLDAGAAWVACETNGRGVADGGDAGTAVPAASCTPTLAATCSGDTATSCPTGVPETIRCGSLLGTTGACVAGNLDPPFDWTSPCVARSDAGAPDDAGTGVGDAGGDEAGSLDAGEAGDDAATSEGDAGDDASAGPSTAAPAPPCAPGAAETCGATGTLTSCSRGAPFRVDCQGEGLGSCRVLAGQTPRAACSPPP